MHDLYRQLTRYWKQSITLGAKNLKFLAITALLGLDINCNSGVNSLQRVEEEAWKVEVCEKKFSEYEEVKLTPIRTSRKEATALLRNSNVDISDPIAGRITVSRIEKNENNQLFHVKTHYKIDAYLDVWTAKKHLQPNKALKEMDIQKKKMNIGKYIGIRSFITKPPEGQYLDKKIARGQILFLDYFSQEPLIDRNKEIYVIVSSNNVRLEMKGVALERAFALNETIKVRLLDTSKILTGKVKDNETVHIEM